MVNVSFNTVFILSSPAKQCVINLRPLIVRRRRGMKSSSRVCSKHSGCWFSSRCPRSCFRLLDTDRDGREVDSGMTANQARSEAGLCLTPGGGLQRFNLRSQVNAQEAAVWQEYKREKQVCFWFVARKVFAAKSHLARGLLFTSTRGETYGI